MATPILIDTDMVADSAAALALAVASQAVEVRAIVGTAGSVSLNQAMSNIGRVLDALKPPQSPIIGLGLEQSGPDLKDRRHLFGADGLGGRPQPSPTSQTPEHFERVYERAISAAPGELVIVCLGPPSNPAAILESTPELLRKVRRIFLTGGAVWCRGDVSNHVEFNFHRDPKAAARILGSRLPVSVVPLDVTSLVCLDQSHLAHLAACGYRTGEVPAAMLEHALEYDGEPTYGKIHVAPVVTLGSLIWPELFMKTRARLQVTTDGPEAGRVKPAIGGDKAEQVDLLTAVNAADLLENVLESICHEAFVV